jgi:hypothetical protein
LLGPDDAQRIAQKFREEKLPCDALIYLGAGYCPPSWNWQAPAHAPKPFHLWGKRWMGNYKARLAIFARRGCITEPGQYRLFL